MDDLVPGLAVALITALVVAGIFIWTGKAKRRRSAALRDLCVQRGWSCRQENGTLRHGHRIEGDGWVLEAVSRSTGRETAPGSSDWGHSTQWSANGEDPGRSTFILGSRLGGMLDVSRVPPQLLSRFLGGEIAGFQAFSAGARLDARFVLLAREKPPAGGLLPARAEELLLAWPARLPIVARSSPARLTLQLAGKRLEDPGEVARFIELGESLAGH